VNTIISALKSISLDETRDKLIDIFEKKLVDTFTSLVEETKTANSNSNSNNNPTSLLSAINSILNDSILCESKNSNQCETKSCNVQCSDGVCFLPKRSVPIEIKQTERSLQKEFDSISKSELIKENEKLHRKIDKIQKQIHNLSEKMIKYSKKIADNCNTINELVADMDSDVSSDSDSD
jgi:vacuolar-type H+-ATPase subunit I/STV1